MYYENFKKLCESKGVKPADVSKATGIATATLSNWKKDNYTPKQSTLQPIADYFNVSVDYLMTGKEPQFTIEMADIDSKLILMDKRIKEYTLKLSKLPKDKQELIINLIDSINTEE